MRWECLNYVYHRTVENGKETIEILENGVLKEMKVDGVPIAIEDGSRSKWKNSKVCVCTLATFTNSRPNSHHLVLTDNVCLVSCRKRLFSHREAWSWESLGKRLSQ